jgi:hypothetical protein
MGLHLDDLKRRIWIWIKTKIMKTFIFFLNIFLLSFLSYPAYSTNNNTLAIFLYRNFSGSLLIK